MGLFTSYDVVASEAKNTCPVKYSAEEAKHENVSNKPVRLVVREDYIAFDGKKLNFRQPFKEWVKVLGNNYIYCNDPIKLEKN